jgi:hypothetical protein
MLNLSTAQYFALTVEKQGKLGYKPIIHAKIGREEKTFRLIPANFTGCSTREAALRDGERALHSGKWI